MTTPKLKEYRELDQKHTELMTYLSQFSMHQIYKEKNTNPEQWVTLCKMESERFPLVDKINRLFGELPEEEQQIVTQDAYKNL